MKADYIINPVKMGGLVKKAAGDSVKIHLHGRLGVLTVPVSLINTADPLEPGHELEFYFSYLEITDTPCDYDCTELTSRKEPVPCLLGGVLTEVNDTAVGVEIMRRLGTIRVPRRWVFTSFALEKGQHAEFYLSRMDVIGKKEIPEDFI